VFWEAYSWGVGSARLRAFVYLCWLSRTATKEQSEAKPTREYPQAQDPSLLPGHRDGFDTPSSQSEQVGSTTFMLVEPDRDGGAVRVETNLWVSGDVWSGWSFGCRVVSTQPFAGAHVLAQPPSHRLSRTATEEQSVSKPVRGCPRVRGPVLLLGCHVVSIQLFAGSHVLAGQGLCV